MRGGIGVRCVGVAVCLALFGCGAPESTERSDADSFAEAGDPAAALMENPEGTSFLMAAGLGRDVALVRADIEGDRGRRPAMAVARTPAGEWSELPLPEVFGDFDLAPVGDTVMIGGFECLSDDCSRLLPRFLVLEDDRRSWREVPSDLPEIAVDVSEESEDGVSIASARPMGHAVFMLGYTRYAVHPDTGPEALDADAMQRHRFAADPVEDHDFYCLTDDLEILVPGSASSTGGAILDGVVLTRSLADASGEFTGVAAAPRIEVDQRSSICGHRSITVHRGPQEHHFDLDTVRWTSRRSNYFEVNDGSTMSGYQLALPDGTVYDENRVRSPEGVWSRISPPVRLVTTSTGVVYAIGADGVTTFREAT